MRRRSLSASRAHGVAGVAGVAERTVLRSDHPVLRATEAVHYTGRQWVHVAAVLAGSVLARIEGREWAGPLAGSAASVLLILTVLVPVHKQRERECAIELVMEGGGRVPIAAVQRQRRRLLAEQTRNGLAGNLEDLIRQAASRLRRQMRVTPLPFEPMVVRVVAGELRCVIGCCGPRGCLPGVSLELSGGRASGVALVRARRWSLREELCRVRDLLENGGM
jgi:hypothetical protein